MTFSFFRMDWKGMPMTLLGEISNHVFFDLYGLLETVPLLVFRNLPVQTGSNRFRCVQHDWHLAELKTEPDVRFTLRYWTWNWTCRSVQGGSGSNWSSGPNFSTTTLKSYLKRNAYRCSTEVPDIDWTTFKFASRKGNLKNQVIFLLFLSFSPCIDIALVVKILLTPKHLYIAPAAPTAEDLDGSWSYCYLCRSNLKSGSESTASP